MGIEVAERYGGAGRLAHDGDARSRGDQPRRRLGRDHGRRAEHARQLPDRSLRHRCAAREVSAAPHIETIGAYALSEAGSGSDAFGLATRAEKQGDGWALTGRKLWITNGAEAGIFVVFANANPSAGYKGITAFLVERDMPGFTVGKKEDKLGIRASSTAELLFDGCVVPACERARRGRPGIQDRDRDAERGTHRHRRADDRHRARRARDDASST